MLINRNYRIYNCHILTWYRIACIGKRSANSTNPIAPLNSVCYAQIILHPSRTKRLYQSNNSTYITSGIVCRRTAQYFSRKDIVVYNIITSTKTCTKALSNNSTNPILFC